jgi:hypothetical protein
MLFGKKKKPLTSAINLTEFQRDEGGISISVKRIDYRQFYDTTWDVYVRCHSSEIFGNSFVKCTIVRDENETAENLEGVIRKLGNIDEHSIKFLDQHDKIYYD